MATFRPIQPAEAALRSARAPLPAGACAYARMRAAAVDVSLPPGRRGTLASYIIAATRMSANKPISLFAIKYANDYRTNGAVTRI